MKMMMERVQGRPDEAQPAPPPDSDVTPVVPEA